MNKKIAHLLLVLVLLTSCSPLEKKIDYPVVDREAVTVPNVIGKKATTSENILKEAGLSNISLSFERNTGFSEKSCCVVIKQSLIPGTKAKKDDEIILQCKKIEKYVNVIDLPINEARKKLSSIGFSNIKSNIDERSLNYEIEKWIVVDQSATTGQEIFTDDEIDLVCKRKCQVLLSLSSDRTIFHAYPIEVYFDETYLGIVDNGYTSTWTVECLSDDHTLKARLEGGKYPTDYKTIQVDSDCAISASIKHGVSELGGIDFYDVKRNNY